MSLRDQLQTIYDRHRKLTPELVLNEARDPEHPLHHRFEWVDDVAAEKWRRQQAHELITSVKVVYRDAAGQPHEMRQFHAVRRETGHVFEPNEVIAEDPVTLRIVMAEAERMWRDMKRRFERYEEFFAMIRRDLDDAA